MPTILDLLGIDCDPKKFNDRSIYRDEMNDGIVMAMGSNNQVAALVGEKLKLKFKYLLLFGGLGSYWSRRIRDERWASQAVGCLFVLLCALAAGILFPIGVFMGTAFPLGMRAAAARSPSLTPWLWGINGATSVCASVVAVIISLGAGISASFWAGWVCYLLAFWRRFGWDDG